RAHSQPRPARQARGRGADGGLRHERDDARVRQPQPRPGETPGHPRRLHRAGPRAGRPARAGFLQWPAGTDLPRGRTFRQGRIGMKIIRRLLGAAVFAFAGATGAWAQGSTLVMASTTSTEQSGLFNHLLPAFARATGITAEVVAVGSGQAIAMATRGHPDVLSVHDRAAQATYVAGGY